jgi:hypothetical protein
MVSDESGVSQALVSRRGESGTGAERRDQRRTSSDMEVIVGLVISPSFALHEPSILSLPERGRASGARQRYRILLAAGVQPQDLLQPVLQPGWYNLVRTGQSKTAR